MKGIKALIIFMGAMIVLGLALLTYGLFKGVDKAGEQTVAAGMPQSVSAPPAGNGLGNPGTPYQVEIALPDGAEISVVGTAGAFLIVQISDGTGRERILTVDPRSGAVVGTILLTPEKH